MTFRLCIHFHLMAVGVVTTFSPLQPPIEIVAALLSNSYASFCPYTNVVATLLELCLLLCQLALPCSALLYHQSLALYPWYPCCLHDVHVCLLSIPTPLPTYLQTFPCSLRYLHDKSMFSHSTPLVLFFIPTSIYSNLATLFPHASLLRVWPH